MSAADDVEGAEQVDRLVADYNLVTMLAFQNFTGLDFEYFQDELAKYGIAVIGSWCRRGLIFHYCKQRGYGGLQAPPAGSFDDPGLVEDLVLETVGESLVHFRDDVLVKGRWDYRRGASLRTFFIGQCLMRFPNIYRAWRAHDARPTTVLPVGESVEFLDRPDPSPDQLVIDMVYGERLLEGMSPRDRKIFRLLADGLKQQEIAVALGMTTKAVERAVANQRARMRRERGA
ncbi:RNA polymerase sigma factor [Kribbella sp. CA-247076]|uniref:RNA polymerase sigma factor n=1 Tax=Kribbella sp. CA-247076 TaxID=3239941 RepID=UPI003D8EAA0D